MKTQSSTLIRTLMVVASISVITACSPKPASEDTSAQTKAIVDQAVAETKKQMLAEQAADKAKQEAIAAEEIAAKARQDAAVAQAIAETKKEFAAKQHAAAIKSKPHKSTTASAVANIAPSPAASESPPAPAVPKKMICTTCGVVVSIHETEVAGKGSGLGVVAGGVVGGLLGNQVGNGTGRDLATIAGAIGGAVAGNKIEQNSKKSKNYNITVKMETGEEVIYHQPTAPNFIKGDAVRIENDVVIKR